jgi:hypothetical protein
MGDFVSFFDSYANEQSPKVEQLMSLSMNNLEQAAPGMQAGLYEVPEARKEVQRNMNYEEDSFK